MNKHIQAEHDFQQSLMKFEKKNEIIIFSTNHNSCMRIVNTLFTSMFFFIQYIICTRSI